MTLDYEPPRKLETALPADRFDMLAPDAIPTRLAYLVSVAGELPYTYFELPTRRWGWLRDPLGRRGPVFNPNQPGADPVVGDIYWTIALRQRRQGWVATKLSAWDSERSARLAAGIELVAAMGYDVRQLDGRWSIGPAYADLADPALYLALRQAHGKAKTGGG
jgi:hypothetical protein